MLKTNHCRLCDHQRMDLLTGTICYQTNSKPQFHKKCSWFTLGEKFEKRVIEVNVKYQNILKKKWWAVAYISFFFLAGLFAIGIGIYLFMHAFEYFEHRYFKRSSHTVPVAIIGAGTMLLFIAVAGLNGYLKEYQATKRDKKTVDDVLALYNIDYLLKIKYLKQVHGSVRVVTSLNYKGEQKYYEFNYTDWVMERRNYISL
ncbi:MAG: hypothetical protein CL868_19500 [Cytophagaceae bacterium]|nr:hypothetical protein [Cytophagaceae bacterium]|tara:strand:- start:1032 stop:1634 length:603 start_codon:yes stop_codon:yes gene_type:complete